MAQFCALSAALGQREKNFPDCLAETEGFEPSVRFPVRRFSKALVSATHPRLRLRQSGGYSGGLRSDQLGAKLAFRREIDSDRRHVHCRDRLGLI